MSKTKVAKVIINNPSRAVDSCFSYLFDQAPLGAQVTVPFGRGNTPTGGVVIGFEEVEDTEKLKRITSVDRQLLDEQEVELLLWLREQYICTYYDALKVLLPPGALSWSRRNYSGVGSKYLKYAKLAVEEEALDSWLERLMEKAPAQGRVLEILSQLGQAPVVDLAELAMTTRGTITAMEKKGLLTIEEMEVERNPFRSKSIEPSKPLNPTPEQKKVIEYTNDLLNKNKHETILLRGITGSGKTEVYLQCVHNVVQSGKKAIILVPEIALTPQMSQRFTSRFGSRVAVFHSGLSIGERFDAWNKIKNGDIDVVVGARSAVFAPFDNIGIIVVDEEHENSYHSDMAPKYDAREVAKKRCEMNHAVLLLASATPRMESGFKAVKGEYTLLQIKNRYNNVKLPSVSIVDMRYELSRGNKSFLSFALQDEIEKNIQNKEQTILFLNRRGFSTFVSCRSCGFAATCPECDISLTYHKYSESLVCHYCGYTIPNYQVCPKCGSPHIRYFGMGTQKVEEELHKLFPQASVIRMDIDTTRGKLAHHKILTKFQEEKIDILVGTQMITKGLDFPQVSLVGVLAADMMLYVDDYMATEKTFQLITQVCGRAGRGERRGRAVIQTYCPDHWVIGCAKNQDYRSFYQKEIMLRRKLGYPPFCDVVNIIVAGEKPNDVKNFIVSLVRGLRKQLEAQQVWYQFLGPTPAPISKINNRFRWRSILKCHLTPEIRACLREVYENKEKEMTVSVDINPNSML